MAEYNDLFRIFARSKIRFYFVSQTHKKTCKAYNALHNKNE